MCRKPKRLSEEYIYRTDPEESSEEVAKETWKVWGSRILEVNRTEQPSRVPCIRELKLVPWMYFTRYMPKSSLCRGCILQDACRMKSVPMGVFYKIPPIEVCPEGISAGYMPELSR